MNEKKKKKKRMKRRERSNLVFHSDGIKVGFEDLKT